MPSYRVHLIGGAVTFLLINKLIGPSFSPHYYPLFLGSTLLGSIFPDIDVTGKMQKIFFTVALVALPLALFLHNMKFFIGAGLLCLALLFLRHRGLTHRVWFLIGGPLALSLFLSVYNPGFKNIFFSTCIYFSAGALSHILLDYRIYRLFWRKW